MRVAFVLLLRLVATARAATIELGSDGSTADPKVTFHETTHSNVRAEIESTANAPLALKTASTSGTSPAMRLMVTAAGLVGIGETSPQATLDVNSGATNVVARFKSTDGTAAVKLEDNSGNVELSTSNGGLAVQPAGGTAVVSVLANGRVGIGTNSPDQMLHLSSSSTSVHQYIESTSTSGEAALFLFGKNSAGTTRSGMFKFDQADNLRIGTSSAIDMRFETSDVVRTSTRTLAHTLCTISFDITYSIPSPVPGAHVHPSQRRPRPGHRRRGGRHKYPRGDWRGAIRRVVLLPR